jgi:hypothetical protein
MFIAKGAEQHQKGAGHREVASHCSHKIIPVVFPKQPSAIAFGGH